MKRLMYYQVDHSTTIYLWYIPKNMDLQLLKKYIITAIHQKEFTEDDILHLKNYAWMIKNEENINDVVEYVRQHAELIAEKFVSSLIDVCKTELICSYKAPDEFDVFLSKSHISNIICIFDLPIDNFMTLYV